MNDLDRQFEKRAGSFCVLVRFRVRGDLRYLSHAETMRVFQRACARAGVKMAYSQGFNPRPRMSLVLPRSVGVESDDEIVCLWVEEVETDSLKGGLASELPEGIEIVSAGLSRSKKLPEPKAVRYLIKRREDFEKGKAIRIIEGLLARDEILVERVSPERSKVKVLDVRPFLKSITAQGEDVVVDCAISPTGTIRVDEILGLLQLKTEDLAQAVRRVSVQWEFS
jgi:radical SAM-linked protein